MFSIGSTKKALSVSGPETEMKLKPSWLNSLPSAPGSTPCSADPSDATDTDVRSRAWKAPAGIDSHDKLIPERSDTHMTTEAAKAAKAKYDSKTARYFSLKLNRNTDKDLIEHLDRQENIQGYLKRLIWEDMKTAHS
jgi:hypothetical protein